MPELPDVETFRRYFARTSLRQKIGGVEVGSGRMLDGVSARTLRNRLAGGTFRETRRHGKFLFAGLGKDRWLVLHFGMTGYLDYAKDGAAPPRYTRLTVRFANGARLAGVWKRLLGRVAVTDDVDQFVHDHKLGPDALAVGPDAFRKMLSERGGTLKGALMDQQFIAGIGNVYSDEMLFQARLHPRSKANRLDARKAGALHRAMRHILDMATARKADPDRMPDTWLLPHRKPGAKCPRCGGKIRRVTIAGRHAFVCPRCQKG